MSYDATGPYKVKLEIYATNGKQTGIGTYKCAPGKIPTEDDIKKAVSAVMEQMPEGFRICNRHEFYRELLSEMTGDGDFAIPGPKEWGQ